MSDSDPGPRLHIPIHLRWGDLDAFNHVNNTSMLKLLEEARVRAFWRAGPGEEAPSTAVLDSGIEEGILTLIARQEIEYLAPVPYQRRPLEVQMWFGKLGGSSIEVCYEVFNHPESDGRVLYARSAAVIVLVDAGTGRPTRLTAEMREAWEPFAGAKIEFDRR
ncbi:thioesterase family protein [Microbacterium sp. SD291]|uniref:acyl-CoA thioesterase n=1 Tax=Microbacterium sp. SD291 TaxID=2782007 RepID=UPI001A96251D|nr:thioesterase family protein [Microbacterium sp. SD291]MBO0981500.1 acyl-CoA thioesterase [Microbacterium sp. SD291]